MYWVYIIRCKDQTLYTGITTDLSRRIDEHNGILPKGSRYTQSRRPVAYVYTQEYINRSDASKEESRIKSLSKTQKEHLIQGIQHIKR